MDYYFYFLFYKNVKYISFFLVALIFMTSCSGAESAEERGLIMTSWEWFTIQRPENWKEIAQTTLPLPKSWELVFALASEQEKNNYINNLVVLRSEWKSSSSSSALVKSNISFLQQNMTNFSLISEKNISFLDESQGTIIIFSGRYNTQTPKAFYLQTARNCWENNFFVTLSIAEELESYEAYAYILQSLSCG